MQGNTEIEHNHYQRERSERALAEMETLESIAYHRMDVQVRLERSETREHKRRVNYEGDQSSGNLLDKGHANGSNEGRKTFINCVKVGIGSRREWDTTM